MDHPFVNRMAASFQGPKEGYMLLEPLMGGELTKIIEAEGKLSEKDTRFYAACVASAITYLHMLKIAYRDLKPENLVLDAGGYCKVVDYGFAKVVDQRTYTFCGTPEFIAPEIISNRGHGCSVDWWAFGILVYNMLTGTTPFLPPEASDPNAITDDEYAIIYAIYRRAMRRDGHSIPFPWHVMPTSRMLISQLLAVEEVDRLGTKDESEVMDHEYFRTWGCGLLPGIDFHALHRREIEPPFMPAPKTVTLETLKQDPTPDPPFDLEGYGGTEEELIKGKTFPDY